MNKATVVYYRPGCPFGTRLRIALTLHRVRFTAVRFRADEHNAAKAREATGGNEVSPTVQIEDRWLANPSWRHVVAIARG